MNRRRNGWDLAISDLFEPIMTLTTAARVLLRRLLGG